jgi:hypothetical protein
MFTTNTAYRWYFRSGSTTCICEWFPLNSYCKWPASINVHLDPEDFTLTSEQDLCYYGFTRSGARGLLDRPGILFDPDIDEVYTLLKVWLESQSENEGFFGKKKSRLLRHIVSDGFP